MTSYDEVRELWKIPRKIVLRPAVLDEVAAERAAQDARWGEQNHPSFDPVLSHPSRDCRPERMAERYEIPSATRARWLCDEMFRRSEGTWADILVEEVAEAVAEFKDPAALRTELIQVAAVAVAWVEALDRNGGAA